VRGSRTLLPLSYRPCNNTQHSYERENFSSIQPATALPPEWQAIRNGLHESSHGAVMPGEHGGRPLDVAYRLTLDYRPTMFRLVGRLTLVVICSLCLSSGSVAPRQPAPSTPSGREAELASSGRPYSTVEGRSPSHVSRADQLRPKIMQTAAAQILAPETHQLPPFKPIPPLVPRNRNVRTTSFFVPGMIPGTGAALDPPPSREIFGFVNAADIADPTVGYTTWNYSFLSTIAFFGLAIADNGQIIEQGQGWSEWNSGDLSNMATMAHDYGVRVVLSIEFHDTSSNICMALANASTTVTETVDQVEQKGHRRCQHRLRECESTMPQWYHCRNTVHHLCCRHAI
jgi:hypothetical protein